MSPPSSLMNPQMVIPEEVFGGVEGRALHPLPVQGFDMFIVDLLKRVRC